MKNSLLDFLDDPEWDKPFFKVLSPNDTGTSPGNMAGFVIPKDLRQYFPLLDEAATSADAPTTDRLIDVELYAGTTFQSVDSTRYQFQTWGGTRSPESRITGNLREFLATATGGDILILQRKIDNLDRFRFLWISQKSDFFPNLQTSINKRRWGALLVESPPVTEQSFVEARNKIIETGKAPFEVLPQKVQSKVVSSSRIIRDIAFRRLVRAEYHNRCAVTGFAIGNPPLNIEVEAAHVVPLRLGGADDIRNGLTLSQTIHWAFDLGLVGIHPVTRRVHIPKVSASIAGNRFLLDMRGRKIVEARHVHNRVHKDALEWHWENLVKKWR